MGSEEGGKRKEKGIQGDLPNKLRKGQGVGLGVEGFLTSEGRPVAR